MNNIPKMMPGQSDYAAIELRTLSHLLDNAAAAEEIYGADELEAYAEETKQRMAVYWRRQELTWRKLGNVIRAHRCALRADMIEFQGTYIPLKGYTEDDQQ